MLEPWERMLLLYSVLVMISYTALALVGEKRFDVYLSINILVYFISTSISSPLPRKAEKRLNMVSVFMIIVFVVIVARRIMMILGG